MHSLRLRIAAAVCLLAGQGDILVAADLAISGPRPGMGARFERILCVVPLVGSGTLDDPKRPMFAPAPGQPAMEAPQKSKGFADPPAIVAYHSEPADDGVRVIVEFVARDRAAFKEILASKDPSVQVLDPLKTPASTLAAQLRSVKQNFNLTAFAEAGR